MSGGITIGTCVPQISKAVQLPTHRRRVHVGGRDSRKARLIQGQCDTPERLKGKKESLDLSFFWPIFL
jgi:hypothetical protein